MEIDGKVALVTGASKGIGRATALALASEGAKVILASRNTEELEGLAQQIGEAGSEALVRGCDMLVDEEVTATVADGVEHFGALDILVNNAGLGYFSMTAEMEMDEWDEMFGVNVRSAFLMTKTCLPHLREAGESVVVNVASLAGKNAFIGGAGYAASKHALVGFSRCLMLEERAHGVRVLTVCPGSVATSFFDDIEDKPNLEGVLQPEDVADCVVDMIRMPQRALLSEIDLRPTTP